MSAVYVTNLSINSGTDFEQVFTLASSSGNSDLDLTGYTGEAKIAKHAGAAEANKVAFAVSFVSPNDGIISIALTEEQTSALSEGRYVYDVVLNDGSRKTRVVEGMAFVSKGVV